MTDRPLGYGRRFGKGRDRVLGTYHMPPGRWPSAYGIAGSPVPRAYAGQLVYPFTGR